MLLDIGIFAHDEAGGIADVLNELRRQEYAGHGLRILVLANGCRDRTVAIAQGAAFEGVEVLDLPQGGKSRTWNRFVHDLSRPAADVLVFMDADIRLPDQGGIARLADALAGRPGLHAVNSQPVKDLDFDRKPGSFGEKLIAAGGGGLDDWRSSICGQLYAMPAPCARRFHLPVGLPVEDGFLRAMVLTDALTKDEDFSRIDGADTFHVYESERTVAGVVRHQTRIVIGSAINAAVFAELRDRPPPARMPALASAAADGGWLGDVLARRLPKWPFGWVPFHFLTKRLARALRDPRGLLHPRRAVMLAVGTGFDLVVWIVAQGKLARGKGVGYW